jgi:hypothetical protein
MSGRQPWKTDGRDIVSYSTESPFSRKTMPLSRQYVFRSSVPSSHFASVFLSVQDPRLVYHLTFSVFDVV